MIGNLQTNKINQVIGRVELVHSISSPHLAEAVSRRSEARGIVTRALVEVNVSGEESKSGLSPDDARASLDDLLALPGISLEGLMTMAPANDADAARRAFSGLRELRDDLRLRSGRELAVLSCGMSDDFQIAVEEGFRPQPRAGLGHELKQTTDETRGHRRDQGSQPGRR